MEQMYLIEIFIDKVTIFASDEDEKSGAKKNLIIKIKFGPKVQFIIKEGQLAVNDENKDDIIECDDQGRRKWSRTIRVGKSYLFPSYPDTVLMILSKFPLELEVWNDDANEVEIFVGIGSMHWDTHFFHMLKETSDACKLHEPLTIKQITPIFAECCCRQVGEVGFILRLSALGEAIVTEFQQLMKDPDAFVFRTDKAPSMFQCKRIEGDDPNFCMVGSLYETTTLEDPDVVNNAQKKIEVCTELQSCGMGQKGADYKCENEDGQEEPKKSYPIDKIRMGDITGPCGNANCPLAHKVRTYIRNLEAYKKEASGVSGTKDVTSRKICGACDCKDDKWHRDECPEMQGKDKEKVMCSGCGGVVNAGETCEDNKSKMYGTGATPRGSKTTIAYVFSVTKVPDYKESMFGKDFVVENLTTSYDFQTGETNKASTSQAVRPTGGCCCARIQQMAAYRAQVNNVASSPSLRMAPKTVASTPSIRGQTSKIYNAEVKTAGPKYSVYNCLQIVEDTDCKCSPPKPSPPCKTFDCDCIAETANIAARKQHKPYCPSFKHKSNCPVTMKNEDEEKKKQDDDEDEAEPLPYGLPPIKLGPCPVLGRPCAYPDGFAKMYKTAALPALPPSYSDAGKVCCSKEYERIKKAIKDYMKYEKDHDYRCINKFNVDTERRCCDKEQRLLSLMGRGCCGAHKLAIQEKFKEEKR
ncbi:uncharacterized protein LOC135080519 isoform X1 [Ostrinia nubilalis]|uniref:uncharacterized protein LOC135080519 isoform X1 n=1 Tax=Ostrinia nubilalis TaxID=29057 RepID=UPI00308256B7